MKVNFSKIDMDERPILILKRPDGTPIGVLGNAKEVTFEPNYNELSTLSFKLPARVDGVDTPFYNDVVGLMIVELKDIAQFVISTPVESGDKISLSKSISANSLECEFGRKKIMLPESTYKFFDSLNPEGTVLGMIMEQMPSWRVGSVSGNIASKYRTFDVSDNLYNFIKGTAQQAFNCIFEFDTLNRVVNVRDADDTPSQKQVFISRDNLAKDISVTEETGDIVTRLDVSGADGVDIREVNPTGTNQIIDLDYFVDHGFFSDELTAKYASWKTLIDNNKLVYYNYAIQYALLVSEEIAEKAKLLDLQGEYTSLENIQSVIIQGIASNIRTQEDLDNINRELRKKQTEVDAKQADINAAVAKREELLGYMQAITDACAFEKYFTDEEILEMDPYLIDNEISETSFVASEVSSYSDGNGNVITNQQISFTGATIATSTTASESTVYDIKNGNVAIDGITSGRLISAVAEVRQNGDIVISIYAGNGEYSGNKYPSACISVSGTGSATATDDTLTCTATGTLFFSLNATDYEKKSVAWDLYEYGETLLAKMAQPSYSFSVDSANFIALEDFLLFKNELDLGQRIYIEVADGNILKPICTGARLYFSNRPKLELLFTDTYTATDSQSKLIDLLENSVSMGKTLSAGKFTYEAWTGSGANTDLKNFITSALDTSKNAIMSSTDQAVSWDGSGLRLRKYTDEGHTAFDGEQIWVSNNSIMMTDDGWGTAKMGIGKFNDVNTGDMWGVVAPMVVGTLLAAEELVIESEKKSGSQTGDRTMFRVDADGARLYNADFEIQRTNDDGTTTQILLDPSAGMIMGYYPVRNEDGTIAFDPEDSQASNAKFFADKDGNLYLAGSIYAFDGVVGGWTISQDGLYSGDTDATSVGMTSEGEIRIWAGKLAEDKSNAPFYVQQDGTLKATKGSVGGWYIGDDYIGNQDTKANSSVGMASGTSTDIVFWAGNKTQNNAPFYVQADGTIKATSGQVGGWYIGTDYIGNAVTKANSSVGMASGTGTSVVFWAGNKTQSSAPFRVQADGKMYATSGQVGGWYIGSDYIGNAAAKASSTVGMASGTGTSVVFWAGGAQASAPFRVQANGVVTSTTGTIGGWNIGKDYIGNGSTKANSTIGMATGSGNDKVFWAGGAGNSAKFYIEADGDLYAQSGTFGGTVYATQVSTTYGALVSGQIGENEIKTININATAVTSEKISGGAVGTSKLGNNAVTYGKTSSGIQNSLDSIDALALMLAGKTTCSHSWVEEVDFTNKKYYVRKMSWIGTISS